MNYFLVVCVLTAGAFKSEEKQRETLVGAHQIDRLLVHQMGTSKLNLAGNCAQAALVLDDQDHVL